MKALSLTQPMAWALFHGKDIENRTWNTSYRGRLYVHASRKLDRVHYKWIADRQGRLGVDLPDPDDLVFGAIIGEITLVSVVKFSRSPWFFGPYGFVMRDPEEYEKPMRCKGHLGFFEPEIR